MHRALFRLAVFITAGFYLWEFLFADTRLSVTPAMPTVANLISVVVAFTFGLGVINVFAVHLTAVARRQPGWRHSLIVFCAFAATVALCLQGTLADRRLRTHDESFRERLAAAAQADYPNDAERTAAIAAIQSDYDTFLNTYRFNGRRFFVLHVFKPLVASAMALLGFYITYAAYRAFRLHSRDAAVMMLTATLVIIGRDPIGVWLTHRLHDAGLTAIDLHQWANYTVVTLSGGFQRGLQIGLCIAVLAVSLRIWLGKEPGVIDPAVRG